MLKEENTRNGQEIKFTFENLECFAKKRNLKYDDTKEGDDEELMQYIEHKWPDLDILHDGEV